jgi:hypothetical protein
VTSPLENWTRAINDLCSCQMLLVCWWCFHGSLLGPEMKIAKSEGRSSFAGQTSCTWTRSRTQPMGTVLM